MTKWFEYFRFSVLNDVYHNPYYIAYIKRPSVPHRVRYRFMCRPISPTNTLTF